MTALPADRDPVEDAIGELGLLLGEIPTLDELLAELRPPWMADARCAEYDRDLFFPTRGHADSERVRAVCAGCAVWGECLEYALADPTLDGFWAGTSKAERRLLRQGRTRAGTG